MLQIRHALLASLSLILASSPATRAQAQDATTTGASRAFNPAISLNALILGHALDSAESESGEGGDHEHGHGFPEEGFSVQELELRFTADIDAYARANATIAAHEGEIEIEEIYADLFRLPAGLGLRAGQFYAPFSRENTLHTHQLPFTQRSLALSAMFPEGFTAPGAQLSWLPALPLYTEFRAAALDGSEAAFFGSEEDGGLVGLGQVRSMMDLGESTTLGILAGGMVGDNSAGGSSRVASAGVDLRWKPARRTIYRGFRLNAEYTWSERQGSFDPDTDELDALAGLTGWTAYGQYQFARRWWASARFDQSEPDGGVTAQRWGVSLAFVASEFQAVRLEYSSTDDGEDTSNSVFLQYNITIGSHPAHLY